MLLKSFDSSDFKNLIDLRKFLNNTVFVILKDYDGEFFVKIVKVNEGFKSVESYKDAGWKDCYVISHDTLDFSNGKDLIFKNQLLNVLKKTGHITNISATPIDVEASLVLTPIERNNFETFWQHILETLRTVNTLNNQWDLFEDDDQIWKEKLFDNTSKNSENMVLNQTETILSEIIAWDSPDEIMNYTLEDELGNVFSSNVLARVIAEWLRKMFQISPYKEKIAELVAAENNDRTTNLVYNFFTFDKNYLYVGTDSRSRDFSFNVVKQRSIHSYSAGSAGYTRHNFNDVFLTNTEMKKRLLVLSATFGLRINLKEETVASFPEYDENFAEKMKKEKAVKAEIVSKIMKQLEAEDKEENEYFDDLLTNDWKKNSLHDESVLNNEDTNKNIAEASKDSSMLLADVDENSDEDVKNTLTRSGEDFDSVINDLQSFTVNDSSASNVFKR